MKKTLLFASVFAITVLTAILLFVLPTSAEDVIHSGTWGNLDWTLNETTGELVISGEGKMNDFSYGSTQAWHAYSPHIESVTIGNSVTSIGTAAFYGCSNLTNITIPDSVTNIGSSAFYDTQLSDIYTDVETWLKLCSSNNNYLLFAYGEISLHILDARGNEVTDLVIPDSITNIGDHAFYGCKNLTSVKIGNSVTRIGNDAFKNCKKLTQIVIPDSVTSIGSDAFRNCTNLVHVTVGKSVTSIGDYAFDSCHKLVEIINHSNLKITAGSLDNGYIAYVALVVHTEENKIDQLDDFLFYTHNNTHYLLGYIGNDTEITLPSAYKNEKYKIYQYAFYRTSLTHITIGNSVTNIGSSAFEGCTSLMSITIGNSVTNIGGSAFKDCTSLTSVMIPNSVTNIVDWAFNSCTNLERITVSPDNPNYSAIDGNLYSKDQRTLIQYALGKSDMSFTIPDFVTSIGADAFYGCTKLTSITISNSITSIGNYAFRSCSNLTSVTISNSVTSIGEYAFHNCTNLASVTIPNSVTSIGTGAFNNCTSLTSVTIPNGVTSIGNYAFYNCTNLEPLEIPSSVTTIGSSTFYNCVKVIRVENGISYVDNWIISVDTSISTAILCNKTVGIASYAFENCRKLTSVTLPNSIINIGDGAFRNCTGLTSITIPNSVSSIGAAAFYNCTRLTYNTYKNACYLGNNENPYIILIKATETSITSCQIHPNTKFIHSYAFKDCTSITSITIGKLVTSIGNHAFYSCDSLTSIYYHGTEDAWKGISIEHGNPALGSLVQYQWHAFGKWEKHDNDQHKRVCECGQVEYATHIWDDGEIATKPTHTEFGVKTFTCVCGETKTEQVAKLPEHEWDDGTVTQKPTVDATGILTYTCPCGETKTETVDKLPESANGTCGDDGTNVSWSLNLRTKVFILSGSGSMQNYTDVTATPWYIYIEYIEIIIIRNGVTNVGANSFTSCPNLHTVSISNTVSFIGNFAFGNSNTIINIFYHAPFEQWKDISIGTGNDLPESKIEPSTQLPGTVSGNCGSNIDWTLDLENGKLIISGNGSMQDYSDVTKTPWYIYIEYIEIIIIRNSVTNIGANSFASCPNLHTVSISNTVSFIGNFAFGDSNTIINIFYHAPLEQWKDISIGTGNVLPENKVEIKECIFGDWIPYNDTHHQRSCECGKVEYATHVWDDGVVTKQPTVHATGTMLYTCGCSETKSETINKLPGTVSGNCGGNIDWTLDLETGKLIISGNGGMQDYTDVTATPWYIYIRYIKIIIIEDGVTYIGANAFYQCTNLITVTFSDSVTIIGIRAFYFCSSLKNVSFGKDLAQISESAFQGCNNMNNLSYAGSSNKWNSISIGSGNSISSSTVKKHSCTFGKWSPYTYDSHRRYCSSCGDYEAAECVYGDEDDWRPYPNNRYNDHFRACDVCNRVQLSKHFWVLENHIEPTTSSNGEDEYYCLQCGMSKIESIPKLSIADTEEDTNSDDAYTPNTSSIVLAIISLIAAVGGFVLIVVISAKITNKKKE